MALEDASDFDFDALWSQYQEDEEEGKDITFSTELSEQSNDSSSTLNEPQNVDASVASSHHSLAEVPTENDNQLKSLKLSPQATPSVVTEILKENDVQLKPLEPIPQAPRSVLTELSKGNETVLKPPEPTPQVSPSVSVAESYPKVKERARRRPSPREMHPQQFASQPRPFFPQIPNSYNMASFGPPPNVLLMPYFNGFAFPVPIPIPPFPNNMVFPRLPNFGDIGSPNMAFQQGGGYSSPVMPGFVPPLPHHLAMAFPPLPNLPEQPRPIQESRAQLKRKAPEEITISDEFDNRVISNAVKNKPNFSAGRKLKPASRKESRRCQTKVTLQTPDGQVVDKLYDEEEIRNFARRFKALRCEYGLSQADVGADLGRLYPGSEFSQTTISRFEGLILSHTNMCKLRPPIEQWLADIQLALENGVPLDQIRHALKNRQSWPTFGAEAEEFEYGSLVPPFRKRKRRAKITNSQMVALESWFERSNHPNNLQMQEISQNLDLDLEVVRVWFSNRRQRIRKEIPKSNIFKSEIH